ncbi:S-adenosylhomocysteine hydrolase [Butyrivibrio hungatei DSM 14810]|uniref:S-adenosylhomocysteine hydrolase n=1 Tax=Butyrivibrio hungatei DSM 14810 TaxID=1121132 RepID=A0A1M7T685_9FIRM|nr:NUDIX domain-containing protein [Butyrivibrio hungatei]SHN66198.1 S-adenosylhomocysteine hydrolase [Butyrivibrio hungatei DSM 14810]
MTNYRELVEYYLINNNHEAENLSNILRQMDVKDESEMINRKNYIGHFTASAFVVSKRNNKIIMVHHKVLKKYLQPGGHIENKDLSPLNAAKRELFEETGITSDKLEYRCAEPMNELVPFNISVHKIPENKAKNEKAHYHYDLQYLFYINDEVEIVIDEAESSAFEWVGWNNFKNMDGYKNIAKKIEKQKLKSPERFLASIVDKNIFEGLSCIAVQHIIPSSVPMIKTLKKIFGTKLLVCAKPNSINREVWEELESYGVRIKIASRSKSFNEAYCEINGKTLIIDIGGYFSKIAQIEGLPIVCIVEDTENGIHKYENAISKIQYPIYSVARNPMKRNEDFLVGSDIVFGADYILHQTNKLIQYMNVACVGYGKIGYGICSRLREMGVKPKVIEKDSIRAIQAVRDGCDVLHEKDFSQIDLIFCATGSKCLDILDFRSLNDGTCIVSATSSDDEFDFSYLKEEYTMVSEGELFTEYKNDDNYFYILNRGIPTNFAVNSALGNYILLVHAAILSILQNHIKEGGKESKKHCINSLSEEKNQQIASDWLCEFC